MNYSTTLPPGFKTWNELLSAHKGEAKHGVIVVKVPAVFFREYQVDFIKERAYDEIMEFLNNSDVNDPNMLAKLEQLTQTKLFK